MCGETATARVLATAPAAVSSMRWGEEEALVVYGCRAGLVHRRGCGGAAYPRGPDGTFGAWSSGSAGAGAVAAEAGEFSRRAFEHGGLASTRLEGIAALIAAQTDAALEQARRLVRGELGREVDVRVGEIHALRCEVEANLDFPEDVAEGELRRWGEGDLGLAAGSSVAGTLRGQSSVHGSGQRVVLAGPPNAGKSALFNALLGRERAIVSPLPGTTRDYVEAELRLGGR
jgi:tRNA modification GTPase